MTTTVTFDYDCCGAQYRVPTTIPDEGSALRHASTIDTLAMLADAQHDKECGGTDGGGTNGR